MRIGIIGGGLTGLVAAHALARDYEVDLFEKMPYLGGCLSSYHINDYWIERYYHHCFSSDTTFFSLLEGDLGAQFSPELFLDFFQDRINLFLGLARRFYPGESAN